MPTPKTKGVFCFIDGPHNELCRFCESYPINQEDTAAEVPGVLMGRYAKDRYGHQKEGNPWAARQNIRSTGKVGQETS